MSKKQKPDKPYPEFPLFPHDTGRWAKKIRGKFHYFGPWNDWQAALEKYQQQRDDLHAGRTPTSVAGVNGVTLTKLINRFLESKKQRVDSGELAIVTFSEYCTACKLVLSSFGASRVVLSLGHDDFESLRARICSTRGHVAAGNQIQRVRSLFKYAYDSRLIERPVVFGQAFSKPSKRLIRQERYAKGVKMFESHDIRALIRSASIPLRAMIYLGVNCGFGNHDCAALPSSAIDLDGAWVNFPRPKTSMPRRAAIWPQTVNAIRDVISLGRKAASREDAKLVFITRFGRSWAKPSKLRTDETGAFLPATVDGGISREFHRLLEAAGIHRRGVGFYALRHTFETIGGECGDQIAVNHIMGHVDASMSAVYRERVSDSRLLAVSEHVRRWLEPERLDEVESAV